MARETDPILRTSLRGLDLANPVVLAAGTAGILDEMADVVDLSKIGAIVTKSITPEPREGNRGWRVVPVKAGMLNAVGLANTGVEAFVAGAGQRAAEMPTTVIGSISGWSVADYVRVASAMEGLKGIGAVELNVSCPNVDSGLAFGSTPESLRGLVAAVKGVLVRTRLFIKLSPIAFAPPGLVEISRAAIDAGADALCIANTMPAMAIDVRTRRPLLGRGMGGLSGPAVHPVAVRLIREVHTGVAREAGVPIIGIGGVAAWDDAAEMILAGAAAVEVGTAMFVDPRAPLKIARGLASWAHSQGVGSIGDLVGACEDD